MAKLKTHKATIKRIRVTGSGKIMVQHAASRHLLTNKSDRNTKKAVISAADAKKVKRLVPGLKKGK